MAQGREPLLTVQQYTVFMSLSTADSQVVQKKKIMPTSKTHTHIQIKKYKTKKLKSKQQKTETCGAGREEFPLKTLANC